MYHDIKEHICIKSTLKTFFKGTEVALHAKSENLIWHTEQIASRIMLCYNIYLKK